MLGIALAGALVGGVYGIVHDQITYALSEEYFTKFKFHQFGYVNSGLPDRVAVALIGFSATWWVGLIAAWCLGRRLLPAQERRHALRQIGRGFVCVLGFGLGFGILGYGYGLWRGPAADYSAWQPAVQAMGIVDSVSFIRVGYIHNASYLGGAIGLLTALLTIRPRLRDDTATDRQET